MDSFDQFLKYLLQHDPADFIGFGLGDPTVLVLRPVSSGLPSRGRDVDGAYLVARAADRGPSGEIADKSQRVAHIEFHRRHQSLQELAVDVAEAQIRLFRREGRKILSQVWDLYGERSAPLLSLRTLEYGEDGSKCVYQRVNLRGLGAKELLSQGPPGLWSLVALTRDGQSEEVIGQARDAIEARAAWSSTARADHLAVLWFVAEAEGVPARLMQAYFTEERLMESELYRNIFQKGEAKGEAQGEAKGEAKAYRELLVDELIRRLGMLDPVVKEHVRAVTDAQTLKVWCQEVVRAADADAVRRLVDTIRNVDPR